MKNQRETIMMILAFLGVVAPLVILAVLLLKTGEPSALVSGFIGVVIGSYTTIFSYYFGSSSSSKQKSEQIDTMIAKADEPKA